MNVPRIAGNLTRIASNLPYVVPLQAGKQCQTTHRSPTFVIPPF
jgi:hypothetical protein